MVLSKKRFIHHIKGVLDTCDDYEIRIAKNTMQAVIETLRKNKALQNE